MAELGLFPLPLVLVPTERVPLHIFEPRYRDLIGECIETGDEFGIVLVGSAGDLHDVGTRAAVSQVLEVLPDGRLNVVVEGGDRFRLLEVDHTRSFDIGTVEEVTDVGSEAVKPADVDRALGLYAKLQETVGSANEPPDTRVGCARLGADRAGRVPGRAKAGAARADLAPSPLRAADRAARARSPGAASSQTELQRRAASNGKITPFG